MVDSVKTDTPEAEDVDAVEADRPQLDETSNIWQRISAVMSVVGFIEPDKEINFGGKNSGIGYVSHDMVASKLRRAFMLYGLAIHPTVINHEKDGNRTELTVRVTIVNIDDPKETVETEAVGYGVDQSDKGPGKAYSYAVKYALMKLFMLNSADDIENSDIEHEPAAPRASDVAAAQIEATEAVQTWAENYKRSIEKAATLEDLMEVQRANAKALASDRLPDLLRETLVEIGKKRKKDLSDAEI